MSLSRSRQSAVLITLHNFWFLADDNREEMVIGQECLLDLRHIGELSPIFWINVFEQFTHTDRLSHQSASDRGGFLSALSKNMLCSDTVDGC